MENKNIYNIIIGESCHLGPFEFFRVPGGWISVCHVGVCFVPYSKDTSVGTIAAKKPTWKEKKQSNGK